jgi:UDP-N-acetyl-2-amino-2-deoxyglucuronate dehydrogenase
LELDRASVDWFLSINEDHLPATAKSQGKRTYRSLTMEGREIEFSDGFTDLHTKSYEAILAGQGFGLAEARPSVELVHRLREHKAG